MKTSTFVTAVAAAVGLAVSASASAAVTISGTAYEFNNTDVRLAGGRRSASPSTRSSVRPCVRTAPTACACPTARR